MKKLLLASSLMLLGVTAMKAWNPFSSKSWKKLGNDIKKGTTSAAKEIAGATKDVANDIAKGTTSAAKEVAEKTQDIAKDTEAFTKEVAKQAESAAGQVKEGTQILGAILGIQMIRGFMLTDSRKCMVDRDTHPCYCTYTPAEEQRLAAMKTPYISEQSVKDQDEEQLVPFIAKYTPVLFLESQENALPIAPHEYFGNPQTSLRTSKPDQVVIPAGSLTLEQLYQLWRPRYEKALKEGKSEIDARAAAVDRNYYLDIPKCAWQGSDPLRYTDGKVLKTPISALTFYDPKDKDHKYVYIQYLLYYGYNAPYTIRWKGYTIYEGDARSIQNAHIGDLEHVTLELDNTKPNKPIRRMFYAAHGADEGVWLWGPGTSAPADQKITTIGTHPVIYVARGGHGSYPWGPGTNVRIYGFADDVVDDGSLSLISPQQQLAGVTKETPSESRQWWKRWEPDVQRIYLHDDKRFNPVTMGWLYTIGIIGKHSVTGPIAKRWLGSIEEENKSGMPFKTAKERFVPAGTTITDAKRHQATPPGTSKESGLVKFLKAIKAI